MTRTLGDFAAHKIGLITVPELQNFQLTINDDFIVIGSDGIWDVMNSGETSGFVREHKYLIKKHPDKPDIVAEALVKCCKDKWDELNASKH